MADHDSPVLLITGAGRRLGADTARCFHQRGFRVAIHYRASADEACALAEGFNAERADSAIAVAADLGSPQQLSAMVDKVLTAFGRLDVLINNASAFFPTPVGSVTESDWDALMDSNLKGPFFLAQAAADALAGTEGCVINMVDIYADKPLAEHPVYCMAKAGLAMMTRSLARELAPKIRVNGIAPGAILWPEDNSPLDQDAKQALLAKIPLGRKGDADDIAETAWFLARSSPYVSGQIIAVDGGRSA